MAFTCCGVKYSKKDIETYWCIETDIIKPVTKKYVKDDKVYKEVIETLICKKGGCLKVHIKRFGKLNGRYKVLEVQELSGDEAAMFLLETEGKRTRQPQLVPIELVPSLQNIPLVFGKAVSPTKQRKCYDAALKQKYAWCNKFNNGKWEPDFVESEIIKITN